jgi:four helix bundle protein
MQDYTKLVVWQRARSLNLAVHQAARGIRPQTAPGLRSQLMRATMSIGATIAEGAARETRVDFARFITMAISSTSEVEHHHWCCLPVTRRSVSSELPDSQLNDRRIGLEQPQS